MILVTGPARSGTSAMAKLCHETGIVMGEETRMPLPGSSQHEWEEPVSEALFDRSLDGLSPEGFLVDWMVSRRSHFEKLQQSYEPGALLDWGGKSPFFSIFWREVEAAARRIGEPVLWVVTERDFSETCASIEHLYPSILPGPRLQAQENLLRAQTRIYWNLPSIKASIRVSMDFLREHPELVATQLAMLAGKG